MSAYLLQVMSDRGYTQEVQALILSCYAQPWRKYHNAAHIESMLMALHQNNLTAASLSRVLIKNITDAIFFHDIFYADKKTPPGMNEALSIALYVANIDSFNFGVVEAINASAYHHVYQEDLSDTSKYLLDLDLYSFAKPENLFLEDAKNVQRECRPYLGSDFPEKQKKFYELFLKRKSIYYIHPEWENQARENLTKFVGWEDESGN